MTVWLIQRSDKIGRVQGGMTVDCVVNSESPIISSMWASICSAVKNLPAMQEM